MSSFEQVKTMLTVTSEQVGQVAASFQLAMAAGLAGAKSPLKMLPAFIGKPVGNERGVYLALDFGGTNVRAEAVELQGQGAWAIRRKTALPLKDAGRYDYTTAATDAAALFDFLAGQLAGLVNGETYLLGHTFSFPCRQSGISQAVLLNWTKEIKTAGVEGREIGELLTQALHRRGLDNIRLSVIINDTVGTLLAAAYGDSRADIGTICGTGHNTCYYDSAAAMIINMESGNFDVLPYTVYDDRLDAASEKPSTQRLEKMVAGRYLGEVVRYAVADLWGLTARPYSITTEDLSALVNGAAPAGEFFNDLSEDRWLMLKDLAGLVITRSARLVAATFLGVLGHIDPHLTSNHTIAVDGSLYEKAPGYAAALEQTVMEALGGKAGQVKVRLTKDGSGVGAAVAAAVAAKGG
jgi:hexokinase